MSTQIKSAEIGGRQSIVAAQGAKCKEVNIGKESSPKTST
jgi:hypothetical protein